VRRILATFTLGTAMALTFAAPASATHTGCEHGVTSKAHATVPHGNHQAHASIPYCPPDDAPRHGGR